MTTPRQFPAERDDLKTVQLNGVRILSIGGADAELVYGLIHQTASKQFSRENWVFLLDMRALLSLQDPTLRQKKINDIYDKYFSEDTSGIGLPDPKQDNDTTHPKVRTQLNIPDTYLKSIINDMKKPQTGGKIPPSFISAMSEAVKLLGQQSLQEILNFRKIHTEFTKLTDPSTNADLIKQNEQIKLWLAQLRLIKNAFEETVKLYFGQLCSPGQLI